MTERLSLSADRDSVVSSVYFSLTKAAGRCRFHPWVGKMPWRRAWQPTPVFLPGEPHGQTSLAGYSSPRGLKELNTTE